MVSTFSSPNLISADRGLFLGNSTQSQCVLFIALQNFKPQQLQCLLYASSKTLPQSEAARLKFAHTVPRDKLQVTLLRLRTSSYDLFLKRFSCSLHKQVHPVTNGKPDVQGGGEIHGQFVELPRPLVVAPSKTCMTQVALRTI
jgi:hypothetical protein